MGPEATTGQSLASPGDAGVGVHRVRQPPERLGVTSPPPEVTRRDGSLVNRHDGLVGVVFLVGLARVVVAGGVDRPHDVFATRAFAGDDENVVHLIGGRPVGGTSRPRR